MVPTALVIVLALLCTFVVLRGLLGTWFDERRARQLLASRDQLTEEAFASSAYPASARKAEAARRVRSLLERHAKMSLAGLRVTDRFSEDLHFDLLADPNLFFELDEEFGFDTPVHDYEKFSNLVEQLRTVADLVDYVDRQVWSK